MGKLKGQNDLNDICGGGEVRGEGGVPKGILKAPLKGLERSQKGQYENKIINVRRLSM